MFIRESVSEHRITPKTEVGKKESLHVMFHCLRARRAGEQL